MGEKDPIKTFSYVVRRLKELYPDFAFIHAVEPRVEGYQTVGDKPGEVSKASYAYSTHALDINNLSFSRTISFVKSGPRSH